MNESQGRHLKQVGFVLSSAVLSAILLVFYMLYQYNPSGHFIAGNTLLSPTVAKEMHFMDQKGPKKAVTAYVYEGAEFSFLETGSNERRIIKVEMPAYQKFYNRIAEDQSIEPVTQEIKDLFDSNASALTLYVKGESKGDVRRVFQAVQFSSSGRHYRIQLAGKESPHEWVYFDHPDIQQEVKLLFL